MTQTEYIILIVGLLVVAIILVVGGRWLVNNKLRKDENINTKKIDQDTDIKNVAKKYLTDNKIQNAQVLSWKIMNAPIKTKVGHEIQYLYFVYELLKTNEKAEEVIVVEFINSVYKDKVNKRKVKKFERKITAYDGNKQQLINKMKNL